MTTELLNIEIIRTDGGTQSRACLNEKTLADYVDALRNRDQFPPVDVIFDGANYWLYDGYHRHEAHRRAGRTHISANVHQGDQTEAQWRSYAANPAHGLQRTQEDKERAIKAALRHPRAAGLSDSSLAKHLRVSDKTVTKYRHELETAGEITPQTIRTGADGRTINTANIGANRPAPAKELPPDSSDQIMPVVAQWLRKYTDQFKRTWRDIATIAANTNAKQYANIAAYVRLSGLRFNDVVLVNAIYAALAYLERTEAQPPTSEFPKSTEPPLVPPVPSAPSGTVHIPTYLSAAGCQIQSMGNGTYKIFVPLGPGAPDSRAVHGPITGAHAAVTEMDRLARQRGLLAAPGVELSITKATGLVWATLNAKEFAPAILPAKIAYIKNVPLDEFRRFLSAGETVTDETLQAAIGKVEAALLLAIDHCCHPATVVATGRCVECGLLVDDEDANPQPAPADEREITETLDEAIRRAVCIYAGDREKWQALAASGADYWRINELLKERINSTSGSGGPGLHFIERKRGPIVTISKGRGGPVVTKLIAGSLINAVRKAWSIPEPHTIRTQPMPAPAEEPVIAQSHPSDSTDGRLTKTRDLHTAITTLLDIIDGYTELTGNSDAPAAATRVLTPMLNRLELMIPDSSPEVPLSL